MILRATYRLQLSPGFGFRDAAAVAPYLAALGVSHVYASPFFAARPGSTHGYDVVDHNRLNPELGDEAAFRAMVTAFRAHQLGLIADFVPNHMGIGGASNAYWLSVLEWGRESPYADWFDIDWDAPHPGLRGKILVPFLADAYADVLGSGGLELRVDRASGTLAVWAHGTHKLPICPRDYGEVLRRVPELSALAAAFEGARELPAADGRWSELQDELARAMENGSTASALVAAVESLRGRDGDLTSWADLHALIAMQSWRASKFSLDRDAINYRRFFAISDLAGLRVERPDVFDAAHRLVLELVRSGVIDGIRIDHIDGLRDPKAYALRLRERAARPFYLLVEKILAPDELVPAEWRVDGTTGYDFANLIVGLLVNPLATDALTETYRAFTGRDDVPEDVVHAAKVEIATGQMAAETHRLAARLEDLAQRDARTRDLGHDGLYAGLVHAIAGLDVYRTYVDGGGVSAVDRERISAAISRARKHAPGVGPAVFDFIAAALRLDVSDCGDAVLEFAARVQQVSGAIMAKGLEDTALYRFNRLIALNEVGSDPGRYHVSVEAFHAANARRLEREPNTLLATSTHDTKRGEDARMRIAAISWRAGLWRDRVFGWRDLLSRAGVPAIDPNEEYFFYQLLLGAWPAEWAADREPLPADLRALGERVGAAMLKSVREAGANTRWVNGDPVYEAKVADFVQQALDPQRGSAFLTSFREAAATFAGYAESNSLVQTALKLTVPGVPDIYQGAELWEQSLVDPDNRRSVDFSRRAAMLANVTDAATPPAALSASTSAGAEAKLAVIARLLAFRREKSELFAQGSYDPLEVRGPATCRVCAFVRRFGGESLLVAAALGWRSEDREMWSWFDRPPAGGKSSAWKDVLDGLKKVAREPAPLFQRMPVVVLFG